MHLKINKNNDFRNALTLPLLNTCLLYFMIHLITKHNLDFWIIIKVILIIPIM